MVTLKEVAKLADVGIGTVSRVVNNSGAVKAQTRERVLKAIHDLNYVPNEIARNFKMQESKMVGLMLPSIWHPFFSKLTYFIEEELTNFGYKLLLCNSNTNRNKEIQYLDMLKRNQVAGIITVSYHDYYVHERLNLPIVSIDRLISELIPHVSADNYQGGQLAAQALIQSGVKKIAFIGEEPSYQSSVTDRKRAFVECALQSNIPFSVHTVQSGPGQELRAAKEFVEIYTDIDGVFAGSDMYAAALISELKAKGKRVPEDVQVIGFDGIQEDKFFSPYLSTIVQPVAEIGRESVRILIGIIQGQEVHNETLLPVFLRQGETTFTKSGSIR
jgi:LacI family transcriptional regulator